MRAAFQSRAERRTPARHRVLVVGPEPGAAGGIAVVLGTLLASPLATRFELLPVATYRDAGRAGKAAQAGRGVLRSGWLLATRKPDVVYLLTSSGASLVRKALVAELARLVRRPYVLHVHAGGFDAHYASAPRWERWLVRRVLGGAALVIALSPTWADRLRSIVACRTTSIPNPVAIPREPASLDSSPTCIVSLGRLGERKGSRVLVQAFATLVDRPEARLVLAGDGDLASVAAEAKRLGVNDRVDLPGWIGPRERVQTLSTATIFALPSREEGLPVSLLEAMAYGLPSVVSPVGGIPDVFEDGRHGYFVPPDDPDALADRIRALLEDREAARRMGRQARSDAESRFAIDVVAAQVGDALERVIGEDGPGVPQSPTPGSPSEGH